MVKGMKRNETDEQTGRIIVRREKERELALHPQ
jgi:hypothetical protein